MSSYTNLLTISHQNLLKALSHLDYSYRKIQTLSIEVAQLDEESLQTWESFSIRFTRVIDIFLTRFLRAYVLKNDPGFEGTLRDFVHEGEKLGIIDDAQVWISIHELRNITAHDYSESNLIQFFMRLQKEAPRLLQLMDNLNAINPG